MANSFLFNFSSMKTTSALFNCYHCCHCTSSSSCVGQGVRYPCESRMVSLEVVPAAPPARVFGHWNNLGHCTCEWLAPSANHPKTSSTIMKLVHPTEDGDSDSVVRCRRCATARWNERVSVWRACGLVDDDGASELLSSKCATPSRHKNPSSSASAYVTAILANNKAMEDSKRTNIVRESCSSGITLLLHLHQKPFADMKRAGKVPAGTAASPSNHVGPVKRVDGIVVQIQQELEFCLTPWPSAYLSWPCSPSLYSNG